MSAKHSKPVRGLMSTKSSPMFQGRFGRMFRSLPAASFGVGDQENLANLKALGDAMSNEFDAPKDGKDDEESGIPALYTYFAQFIDHDLTFDPASSLQKQNDPDALADFRTPALDLDCIYGRGPDDQPYLYDGSSSFLLGDPIKGGSDPDARDLPRNTAKRRRALIGDPRNDENSIVSQLQGLFLRFHNRMLDKHPHVKFEHLQRLVRFHYQYVILNDFLTRIVRSEVLEELKTDKKFNRDKLKFFQWKNEPFMPVEFSVAAYRFGHSMVRPGYRLNDQILRPIFPIDPNIAPGLQEGLTGFQPMVSDWGIDWGRFIDVDLRKYDGTPDENAKRLQLAYRIDTSITFPLANLPAIVAQDPASLPQRNLERGWRMGLPSGQSVAAAMGVKPFSDDDILIGAAVNKPDKLLKSIVNVSKAFANNCPLWTYILAEAVNLAEPVEIPVRETVKITTPKLGPVGGRIVAEVFLGLMFGDNHSMLSLYPDWHPDKGVNFRLKDFVNFALGKDRADPAKA